tara:strand:+ start:357 stop:698 length:342 start_codon:yes stop_codon:yes gene_type:complete
MAFKIYEPTSLRYSGKATVSISRHGFRFGKSVSLNYLKEKSYVELYFDEDNNKIGLKPLDRETNNSKKLRGREGKSKTVTAKDFLESYNCSHPETKQYQVTWNNDMGLIEIQL